MATLPSPDSRRYSPVHLLRRRKTERENLTAAFATSSLGRGPRWWQTFTFKAAMGWIAIFIIGGLALRGIPPRKQVSWHPDKSEGRVILMVKDGWFSKPKYLPLYWRYTRDYAAQGEMAWCAWVNRKWEKVYPFGEDLDRFSYRKEWLFDSPWVGQGPPQ